MYICRICLGRNFSTRCQEAPLVCRICACTSQALSYTHAQCLLRHCSVASIDRCENCGKKFPMEALRANVNSSSKPRNNFLLLLDCLIRFTELQDHLVKFLSLLLHHVILAILVFVLSFHMRFPFTDPASVDDKCNSALCRFWNIPVFFCLIIFLAFKYHYIFQKWKVFSNKLLFFANTSRQMERI